ncbi:FkbM family methyltransferase [Crateriforma spongiae]|uniref:FkbM family methyltransferase n=1 Tax=Crateriforma spongiae TaxID=2724528 RepID=UPI0039AFD6CA
MLNKIRKALWKAVRKNRVFQKPSVRYCSDNLLLPSVFVGSGSAELRETLFLPASEYSTQLNQDIFALLVNRFKRGYFVEIGANDGYTLSNTVYLEKKFGWDGLLIEPNPRYANSLHTRRASVAMKAVSDRNCTVSFVDAGLYGGITDSLDQTHQSHTSSAPIIDVEADTIERIFESNQVPARIDYLSLDVEGGEMPIIRQLFSGNRRISCGTIELNSRESDIAEVKELFASQRYELVWVCQTAFDCFFIDSDLDQ